MFKKVNTDKAPTPLGPYSQAIIADNVLYISMQLPIQAGDISPEAGAREDIVAQTKQLMKNAKAIIDAADFKIEDIAKVTIYLTDLTDGKEINAIYAKFFPNIFPARSLVNVKSLPFGYKIAADFIAQKA